MGHYGRRSHRLLIHVPPSVSNATSIRRTLTKIACVRPGHPFSVGRLDVLCLGKAAIVNDELRIAINSAIRRE